MWSWKMCVINFFLNVLFFSVVLLLFDIENFYKKYVYDSKVNI